jgi:hypothetical protein
MTATQTTQETPTVADETITAYKGFDKDLKCRGFQYAIGETFEHAGPVEACSAGFHACEYPLDVFGYYPPAGSRFALVEQSGDIDRHGENSKVASRSISVKAELTIAGLVKAAIEYTTSRCTPVDPASPASATGYQGAASATGYQGAASATGDQGAASATGDQGAASATGDQGAASATGTASVAVATGWEGQARAAAGCAIVLVNRADDLSIRHIRAAKVGDDGIKPDTWYRLNAEGQFEEVAAP